MKPMLLQWWPGSPPDGWWSSEKYDGCRALWTGSDFRSRGGHRIDAPEWFAQGLPPCPLDGELWAGYGSLPRMLSAFARGARADWRGIRFLVFDVPDPSARFERRLAHLGTLALPRHARLVRHERVADEGHFLRFLRAIEARGGEGAVLRQPGHRYTEGRSWAWQKYKLQPEEAEA